MRRLPAVEGVAVHDTEPPAAAMLNEALGLGLVTA